jgi:peptidoglycan hydrolase-like protein with peptidoglycan-binding domain
MFKTLSDGSEGVAVIVLQSKLNSKPPTALPALAADGIFGPKTLTRVKEFQKKNGLQVDGIVGPITWGKLLAGRTIPIVASPYCDNIRRVHLASTQMAASAGTAPSSSPGFVLASFSLPKLPTLPSLPSAPKLRPLKGDPTETICTAVYGSTIDTSVVSLSDKTGLSGRAFVLAIPVPFGKPRQIMNVGTSPTRDTMVHELAHVWQSQHATKPTQYMENAVASQGLAEAANLLAGVSSFSAYGYRPGKPFGEYAAEQIAQQAQRGEAAIISHMKGVAAWAVDGDNDTSLKTPRIEDTSSPGVKT